MKAKSKILIGAALLAVGSTAAFAAVTTISVWSGISAVDATHYSGTDGVNVTAVVQPTLSMVISNDDVVLPDLSPTAVIDGTPFTVTVNTNAAQGATVGVTSSKAGLGGTAATDNHLIGFATPTATAEGYNLTVDGATSTAGAVPSIPTATIAVATSVGILSTTGPTAGAQVTVTPHASISAITPADTYSVAHTFTVTGTY